MKLNPIEAMKKVNYFGLDLSVNPDMIAIACDIEGDEVLVFSYHKNSVLESKGNGFYCSLDNDFHKIFLCTAKKPEGFNFKDSLVYI